MPQLVVAGPLSIDGWLTQTHRLLAVMARLEGKEEKERLLVVDSSKKKKKEAFEGVTFGKKEKKGYIKGFINLYDQLLFQR